jgi:Arc/MetJ-type ribon-helix-helix transcriptional regulator
MVDEDRKQMSVVLSAQQAARVEKLVEKRKKSDPFVKRSEVLRDLIVAALDADKAAE